MDSYINYDSIACWNSDSSLRTPRRSLYPVYPTAVGTRWVVGHLGHTQSTLTQVHSGSSVCSAWHSQGCLRCQHPGKTGEASRGAPASESLLLTWQPLMRTSHVATPGHKGGWEVCPWRDVNVTPWKKNVSVWGRAGNLCPAGRATWDGYHLLLPWTLAVSALKVSPESPQSQAHWDSCHPVNWKWINNLK